MTWSPVAGVWLERLASLLLGLRSVQQWLEIRLPVLARPRKPLRAEMMNCPARGLLLQPGLVRGLPELPMLVLQGYLQGSEPTRVSRQHRLRWLIRVGCWRVRG